MVRIKNISIILVLIILPVCLVGCKKDSSTITGSKTGSDTQLMVDFDGLNTTGDNDDSLSNGDEIETTNDIETTDVKEEEPIIWYADLTHDGVNEKIVVDLTYVINYPETGEEKTVSVYSGSSGELLFTGHADTVHPGWNGIYIYNDGKNDYLLLWQPTIYQDIADFNIRIFSLTENGKENDLLKKSLDFSIYNPKDSGINDVSDFVDMVNEYLEKSYVLVDTDDATPVYSTANNKIINLYDVSWILDEMKKMEENK